MTTLKRGRIDQAKTDALQNYTAVAISFSLLLDKVSNYSLPSKAVTAFVRSRNDEKRNQRCQKRDDENPTMGLEESDTIGDVVLYDCRVCPSTKSGSKRKQILRIASSLPNGTSNLLILCFLAVCLIFLPTITMWRSRALLIARRSAQYRARGATLGAAVSLVVLSSLDRQDQDTEMNLSSRDNYEGSDRALNTIKANPLSILSGLTVSSASCEAGTMASPIGRRTRLARRATIRKMDENQSRDTLRSKYAVDWDDPLGEGGFGAVYLATDRRTGEKVACKKIDKKFTDDSSFQHEMNALLHLRKAGGHPNICSLREHFNEDGYYYLILDLVQGGEMFDHLVANGAYSEADAARLVREVASALAFVHGMDTTHGMCERHVLGSG
jgi:hypothetical protein